MLAIDHGYFLGPTSGLERIDVTIVPLLPYCDALMLTRGILRTTVPAAFRQGVVMRASGGPSIRKELSNELLAVDVEDAAADERVGHGGAGLHRRRVRDADGDQHDEDGGHGQPLRNADARRHRGGQGHGARRPVLPPRLPRICAELGAQFVKTYYVAEDFETVTASCPVPIVMAGGKKLPELEALTMAYSAVSEGAAGVDMGRNIFQSEAPVAMIQAVQQSRARADEARARARAVPDAQARAEGVTNLERLLCQP